MDPFGNRYDCERAKLAHGDLTDDQIANQVYLTPSLGMLTAAKDRIRWLSRKLVEATIPRPITFEGFRDALLILRSIDLPDLQEVGLFQGAIKTARDADDWGHWELFRDDPLRFLLGCDDATARKIWSAIEKRQRVSP